MISLANESTEEATGKIAFSNKGEQLSSDTFLKDEVFEAVAAFWQPWGESETESQVELHTSFWNF